MRLWSTTPRTRTEKQAMGEFRRQVVVPAGVAVLAAAVAYGLNTMFGPEPRAWLFEYGTVLFYVPWLIALSLISACATFWARRTGASVSRRILVAISPALVMGGMVTGFMAVVVAAASTNGHHVYPLDAIGHFLIGWILVPGAVGLVGALPFLPSARNLSR
jgi:hypothetical protein